MAATVSLTIKKTTQLVVSSSSTFSLLPSAGVLTATDYNAGFYDVASILTVTGSSNATWGATIASNTATFGAPCASKPASQLLWGRTAVTRSTPMSTSAAPVFPLASNVATAGLSQSLYFRVQVGWTTDPPSACSIGISFTITAP